MKHQFKIILACAYLFSACQTNSTFDQLKMPLKDLFLMKSCNHNIIANSTFSWWGAWLNENLNKIVCVPKYWTFGVKSSETDLIPSNWNIL